MSEHSNQSASTDMRRRHFLIATTSALGVTGLIGVAVPFVASWLPSARARSVGGPVDADIGKLEPGQQVTLKWRGKPIWILRRTPQVLADLDSAQLREHLRDPDSTVESQQPEYARNAYRSIESEYLVVVAICTHLGCIPTYRPDRAPSDLGADWVGGYYCPCHGSKFDLAGRVFKSVPAPTNLVVPPYRYLSPTRIQIGKHTEKRTDQKR